MLQMVSTPVGVVCGTFNSVAGGSQVRGGVVCALRIVYSTHLESPSSIIFVYQRPGSSFFSAWDFSPFAFVVWTVGAAKCFGHSAASMEYLTSVFLPVMMLAFLLLTVYTLH